ncbi:hypothetical protein BCV70DRAFT_100833 [Testicularia cyperi]|uniref:Uncharacterized protein n=1 Tax=Testicularia cyperi TaxID=1882483 RepID=A0A317XSB0_9BASI|nr:hypothetical protein BCV70DRAFT_100833 [Testicularia cyperi]
MSSPSRLPLLLLHFGIDPIPDPASRELSRLGPARISRFPRSTALFSPHPRPGNRHCRAVCVCRMLPLESSCDSNGADAIPVSILQLHSSKAVLAERLGLLADRAILFPLHMQYVGSRRRAQRQSDGIT